MPTLSRTIEVPSHISRKITSEEQIIHRPRCHSTVITGHINKNAHRAILCTNIPNNQNKHTPKDKGPRNIINPRNPESFLTLLEAYLAATNADRNPNNNHVIRNSKITLPSFPTYPDRICSGSSGNAGSLYPPVSLVASRTYDCETL